SDLMIDIRNDVYEKTDRQQMPWESSSLLTPFAFNQTELDLDGQEDLATAAKLRVLGLSEKSDNPELIESFLIQYPYSRYKQIAGRKLDCVSSVETTCQPRNPPHVALRDGPNLRAKRPLYHSARLPRHRGECPQDEHRSRESIPARGVADTGHSVEWAGNAP